MKKLHQSAPYQAIAMRFFHSATTLRAIRPVFKPHNSRKGTRTFDSSFEPSSRKPEVKIWDQKGISKDEFFVRKYGNISPEKRKQLDAKVERQRYLREQRRKHELGDAYEKPKPARTTLNPLSEYLFGTHPVISALSAGKRKAFNTLYTFNAKEDTPKILSLAKKYGVRVVEKSTKREMNQLSSNGVHNGVVLETKPLPVPYIGSLGQGADGDTGSYVLNIYDERSDTDHATPMQVAREVEKGRSKYPFGLYIDGVTDPQNLGNIVRSAYFLGADFMVLPENESARLGPVAAKAAAGALDLLNIYKTDDALKLIDEAKKNGWCVVTTGTKESQDELDEMKDKHRRHIEKRYIDSTQLPLLLGDAPMLMVIGSEGLGVRASLKLRSDYLVGLKRGRVEDSLVDSLNVGVAAGTLMSKCFE